MKMKADPSIPVAQVVDAQIIDYAEEGTNVMPPPAPFYVSEEQKKSWLRKSGIFPEGIVERFRKSCEDIAIRYWVIDNSGSMSASDGHRFIMEGNDRGRFVSSTRWEELCDSVEFHASVAANLGAPTQFRLLNQPSGCPLNINVGYGQPLQEMAEIRNLIASSPLGRTPLCQRIKEIIYEIRDVEQQLRANNKHALIVIASDGEPSDGDVEQALRPLRDLPVWVVVRLCTEEDSVVDFWNEVDTDLELQMDVLDDVAGEAKEVHDHNSFLTYGLPLHRLREWGCTDKIFDVIDEQKLTLPQVQHLVSLIYGPVADDLPHPELNWKKFLKQLKKIQTTDPTGGLVFDPLTKRSSFWFNLRRLNHLYGHGTCHLM
uniref:VWFA domain-containing protein n=1 Tax=Aureoumbra lagunensis TaxID=44058 RepID=A0A7S3NEZ6_9STRA|mmetsp:Transcript_3898/g.5450  ORF Transcript_3898/g.5450 Transcript_3898/m.5450 type:complete len:373 (+) Transcript_3898:86-1204(+)